jgi:hypothetical protein
MVEMMIRVDYGTILGVLAILFVFGIAYNWAVGQANRRGWSEGYMSLLVSMGCGMTLFGAAFISLPAAGIVLLCFMASGLPMIAGDISRYIRTRDAEKRSIVEGVKRHLGSPEVKHDNYPEGMA